MTALRQPVCHCKTIIRCPGLPHADITFTQPLRTSQREFVVRNQHAKLRSRRMSLNGLFVRVTPSHSNWRRNGTRQHVENTAMGETCSLSHVRGNGCCLRHPDDGSYRRYMRQATPRGPTHLCANGSKERNSQTAPTCPRQSWRREAAFPWQDCMAMESGTRRLQSSRRREREDVPREVPRLQESLEKNTDCDHFEPIATEQQSDSPHISAKRKLSRSRNLPVKTDMVA